MGRISMDPTMALRRGESGVMIVDGRETMGQKVGRLDMNTIVATAELMIDLRDHEILLTATVGGGLVLPCPHHVVLVNIYSTTLPSLASL
jgi:hypothetical protein